MSYTYIVMHNNIMADAVMYEIYCYAAHVFFQCHPRLDDKYWQKHGNKNKRKLLRRKVIEKVFDINNVNK